MNLVPGPPSSPLCPGTRWELAVYTSDIRHAGTDAEVYVNLFGNKGRSGQVVLGKEQKDRDKFFERASVDVFVPEVRG